MTMDEEIKRLTEQAEQGYRVRATLPISDHISCISKLFHKAYHVKFN